MMQGLQTQNNEQVGTFVDIVMEQSVQADNQPQRTRCAAVLLVCLLVLGQTQGACRLLNLRIGLMATCCILAKGLSKVIRPDK